MTDERNDRRNENPPPSDRNRGPEDAISRNLKRAYEQVANEPLPDTLSSLLEKLKKDG